MIKKAYEAGVKQAMIDAGLIKEALKLPSSVVSALAGGGLGALVAPKEDRLKGMGAGLLAGAALPYAMRGGRALGRKLLSGSVESAVDPLKSFAEAAKKSKDKLPRYATEKGGPLHKQFERMYLPYDELHALGGKDMETAQYLADKVPEFRKNLQKAVLLRRAAGKAGAGLAAGGVGLGGLAAASGD